MAVVLSESAFAPLAFALESLRGDPNLHPTFRKVFSPQERAEAEQDEQQVRRDDRDSDLALGLADEFGVIGDDE